MTPSTPMTPVHLSPRLREVAYLVHEGKANKEIAAILGLSEGTIRVYVHALMEKLGARSRTQVAVMMHESLTRGKVVPVA